MIVTNDVPGWLGRGTQLRCFDTRTDQIRYLVAWSNGNTSRVLLELERILSRNHRMPALNWLALPELVLGLDELEDGPEMPPESWTDADFAVEHPDGTLLHPSWLEGNGAWDELLAATVRSFIFLQPREKVRTARNWSREAMETYHSVSVQLKDLVSSTVRSEMLNAAVPSSQTLGVVLGGDAPGTIVSSRLKSRATALLAEWRNVTQPRPGGIRFLTMAGLRSCGSVLAIDEYLAECTSEATANLMSYLRCS